MPYVDRVLVSVIPVFSGAGARVGAFIGPMRFLLCSSFVAAIPENTSETLFFSAFSSSPHSIGRYSSVLTSSALVSSGFASSATGPDFSSITAGPASETASRASPAVFMTMSSSAGTVLLRDCATRSGTKISTSSIASSSSTAGFSTTATISSPSAAGRIISSDGWLNMTPAAMAAATAVPAAARFHHSTTVLCCAALSRSSETLSQTPAGTSSVPSSRMDFIILSNSFMSLLSNIFNLLNLVLQPCPCPAQLSP